MAPKRPSEVFAQRLRFVRERRHWTQQDLADRMAELGHPIDRATIARTENGTRGLSLDDAMLYAAALGAAPVNLMTITAGDALIAVSPKNELSPSEARAWIRGSLALVNGPGDKRTYQEEVAEDEWEANSG